MTKDTTLTDRATGALMGAFIGDALGLGPHWYYDLDEQRHDYGEWINDYTDPQPDRYHAGYHAGDLSQAGVILKLTLNSLIRRHGYDEADFTQRLDDDLFHQLDGTAMAGPGGYTSQSIREAWKKRVIENKNWDQTGGHADTTEAIERTLAIAVRYARSPDKLADGISRNCQLTQIDETVVSMTVAYGAVLGMLVAGHQLDEEISGKLMTQVKSGDLPFHSVTNNMQPQHPSDQEKSRVGTFASPDALLSPSYMAIAANDPTIQIEPAWKVSQVYGMPCAIYHILPAAYYLTARFPDDFESAVLHAINGGGQNQSRAILTGALVGAQCGLSGIPQRFVDGLTESKTLLELCKTLAAQINQH